MKTAEYKEICSKLGMKSEIRFVKVTKAGITFTAGRPDDIIALLKSVREAQMKPAPSLLRAVRSVSPYNMYLSECA
jgi:hypothetical protein